MYRLRATGNQSAAVVGHLSAHYGQERFGFREGLRRNFENILRENCQISEFSWFQGPLFTLCALRVRRRSRIGDHRLLTRERLVRFARVVGGKHDVQVRVQDGHPRTSVGSNCEWYACRQQGTERLQHGGSLRTEPSPEQVGKREM